MSIIDALCWWLAINVAFVTWRALRLKPDHRKLPIDPEHQDHDGGGKYQVVSHGENR